MNGKGEFPNSSRKLWLTDFGQRISEPHLSPYCKLDKEHGATRIPEESPQDVLGEMHPHSNLALPSRCFRAKQTRVKERLHQWDPEGTNKLGKKM